jgi:hypothetical protein
VTFRPNAEALYSGVRMALFGDSFESVTHSFVVRIWLEEDDRAKWRGHITHVPSGDRQYVERLADVADFIAHYVDGMKVGRTSRVKRWWSMLNLKRRKDGGHRG